MSDSKSTDKKQSTVSDESSATAKQSSVTQQPPAKKEAPVNKSASSESNNSNQKQSSGLTAVLFSLAALGAAAFTWYQTQVQDVRSESNLVVGVTEIGGQVNRLGDSIEQLKKQQDNVVSQEQLSVRLNEVNTSLNSEINNLGQQQKVLAESIEKINGDLGKGVNAYVLNEVGQLLKMANNSALFSQDVDSAISALSLADAQLKGLNDPRYTSVRAKITEEVSALKNVETVDVTSVFSQLSGISKSISSLPLANEPVAEEVQFSTPETESTGWRAELSTLWTEMKNSIQVQRVDQPPKPLLAPKQRYFLNQNLQLMFSKAQLALLQQRQSVFDESVNDATQWLTDYFDTKDSRVSEITKQLEQLKQTKIVVQLPSITGSYDALQSIRGEQ